MLFTKSVPVVSRSAYAAKTKSNKFWGTQNQTHTGPSFFVSTPQFNRHTSQLVGFLEDPRGTGSSGSHNSESYGVDNPYLALSAGANVATAAPATVVLDNEIQEENIQSLPRLSSKSRITLHARLGAHRLQSVESIADASKSSSATKNQETDLSQVYINQKDAEDNSEPVELINGMLRKMLRLHSVGSHSAVLSTFADMETVQASQQPNSSLPIEAYNVVLMTLASSSSDANTLLEAYEKMLSRGLLPNNTTYSIILNTLAKSACELATKRSELEPFLGVGNGILESVDEVREGLAVEEYLMLSQTILEAIITAHSDANANLPQGLQNKLDELVSLCIEYSIEVPDKLLAAASPGLPNIIAIQPSIEHAVRQFSSLSPEQQQSQKAQELMLKSYFRFKQPSAAIAFFSGCGSPQYLLRVLLEGFASVGLVGVARRWVEETSASPEVIGEVLKSIPINKSREFLPSATQLFYMLTGSSSVSSFNDNSGGSSNRKSGRCGFIRLCVSAENPQALFMAIRESKYRNIMWDAITIREVISYLCKLGEPLLAADVCVWQVSLLSASLQEVGVQSFVVEELISETVRSLKKSNQLSLDASLRLLPVVLECLNSRMEILDIIATARVHAPHDVASIMDSRRLNSIVSSLATFIISDSFRATKAELDCVSVIFPLFLEDALTAKTAFTSLNARNVSEALQNCDKVDSLVALWNQRARTFTSLPPEYTDSEISRTIQRYALTKNGLDYAISLLKDQIRLKKQVSATALDAVLASCIECDADTLLPQLFDLLPHTALVLNSLAKAASSVNNSELVFRCCSKLVHELGIWPDHSTYLEMIKCKSVKSMQAIKLYHEARDEARIPLNSDFYNNLAAKLAQDLCKTELSEVLVEMKQKGFHLCPSAYGHIISMSVRLGEGQQALAVLKAVPATTKSLLEVKVFNHLMHYFVHKDPNRQAALEVFMELRKTGTLATPYTYRLLMEAYLISDEVNEPSLSNAERVLSLMRQDGAPITTQCFATLLRARGVLFRDFESARNFYRGIVKNSRVSPDQGIFKALMESYICNGRQAESGTVLEEMKRYHVPIDKGFVQIATSS